MPMDMPVDIRRLPGADPLALDLIWRTFLQFEAPDYTEEGVRSFADFLRKAGQMPDLECAGAFLGEELVGVIATREEGSHICLLFVEAAYQRRGIGRRLWRYVWERTDQSRITVHAAPYAVAFYERIGFRALGNERITDGIRYTPMAYTEARREESLSYPVKED